MSNSLDRLNVISLFVADVAVAKTFYQRIFGARIIFEDADSAVVGFDNVMLNLLVDTQAADLVAPTTVATKSHGVRCQFTIFVDDVDSVCEGLVAAGVTTLTPALDRPWGKRTACFEDPDGHNWEVAQDI